MTLRLLPSVSVLVLLAAVACSTPAPQPAPTPATPPSPPAIRQAAVEQSAQDIAAALVAGDAAKAAGQYATDAVFVNARGKFDTRAGIEAFWAGALKTPAAGKDLKLEIVKWGTSGDLAYSVSRFTGGITAKTGYVLAVSERQADGSLKTVAQVSIPDPPGK